ncbi:MAG: hypothetical protein KA210_04530 [Bacteroidia bacterium]|nr:hypothetical protein [Bacteroidia bacterium]
METKKVIFNRPKISSKEINEKQDFDFLLNQLKTVRPYLFKRIIFYGAIGLSCSVGIIMLTSNSIYKKNKENKAYEKIITLKKTNLGVNPNKLSRINIVPSKVVHSRKSHFIKLDEKLDEQKIIFHPIINDLINLNPSNLPSISGIENGQITQNQFLKAKQIDVPNYIEIQSYTVNYFKISDFVSIDVIGSSIPDSIKEEIINYSSGLPVSFTNIIMKHLHNDKKNRMAIQLFIK